MKNLFSSSLLFLESYCYNFERVGGFFFTPETVLYAYAELRFVPPRGPVFGIPVGASGLLTPGANPTLFEAGLID